MGFRRRCNPPEESTEKPCEETTTIVSVKKPVDNRKKFDLKLSVDTDMEYKPKVTLNLHTITNETNNPRHLYIPSYDLKPRSAEKPENKVQVEIFNENSQPSEKPFKPNGNRGHNKSSKGNAGNNRSLTRNDSCEDENASNKTNNGSATKPIVATGSNIGQVSNGNTANSTAKAGSSAGISKSGRYVKQDSEEDSTVEDGETDEDNNRAKRSVDGIGAEYNLDGIDDSDCFMIIGKHYNGEDFNGNTNIAEDESEAEEKNKFGIFTNRKLEQPIESTNIVPNSALFPKPSQSVESTNLPTYNMNMTQFSNKQSPRFSESGKVFSNRTNDRKTSDHNRKNSTGKNTIMKENSSEKGRLSKTFHEETQQEREYPSSELYTYISYLEEKLFPSKIRHYLKRMKSDERDIYLRHN